MREHRIPVSGHEGDRGHSTSSDFAVSSSAESREVFLTAGASPCHSVPGEVRGDDGGDRDEAGDWVLGADWPFTNRERRFCVPGNFRC